MVLVKVQSLGGKLTGEACINPASITHIQYAGNNDWFVHVADDKLYIRISSADLKKVITAGNISIVQ